MKHFSAAKTLLGELEAGQIGSLLAAACDIVLVLDQDGIIQDVALGKPDLARELGSTENWFGRRWTDFLADESRSSAAAMLRAPAGGKPSRWHRLRQDSGTGEPIPLLCSAARLDKAGRIVVFGRDRRADVVVQRRLLDAHVSAIQDQARLRKAETRYRLLFHMSPEPMLLAEGAVGRVRDVNPAAETLLGQPMAQLLGKSLGALFGREVGAAVRRLAAGVAAEAVAARMPGRRGAALLEFTPLPGGEPVTTLVRLGLPQPSMAAPRPALLGLVESLPDAFVVTDANGRIIAANAALLGMAQLESEAQAIGQPLDRWLGRSGGEFALLLAGVRAQGSMRAVTTQLRGEHGRRLEVEVSAVAVRDPDHQPCFGFSIRSMAIHRAEPVTPDGDLGSFQRLQDLVGRLPLRVLVQEATGILEQLCIRMALQVAGNNRSSAARILGLSRQALHVKLRQYGEVEPLSTEEARVRALN